MKKFFVLLLVAAGSPALADFSSSPSAGSMEPRPRLTLAGMAPLEYRTASSMLSHHQLDGFARHHDVPLAARFGVFRGEPDREGMQDRARIADLDLRVVERDRNDPPNTWWHLRLRDETDFNQGSSSAGSAAAGAPGNLPQARLLPVPGGRVARRRGPGAGYPVATSFRNVNKSERSVGRSVMVADLIT